ncbi:protein translocase subunit SecD [Alphaproteobacteria bacterium]|nr:protein translocase subunit SecD [Alphaproteobacteria bacterium]
MKKLNTKFLVTLLILFFSIFYSIPAIFENHKSFPKFYDPKSIRLGLDLQGGSQLLLQVETQETLKEKIQNFTEDIRIKFQENNIAFNDITGSSNEILISLKDKNSIESALLISKEFSSFKLEREDTLISLSFKDEYVREFYSSLMLQSLEIIRKRIDEVGTNEPIIQIQGNQRILVQLPGLKDPDRIKALLGKTAKMNFRLVDEKNMQFINDKKYFVGSEIIEHADMQVNYVIKKRIGVSGDNLVDASASVDQFSRPIVSIRFDSIGSRKFADLTSKNVGKRFAIVLDNKVISAPVIQEAIPTGSAQISGNFTYETANDLAILLRAGSLPAPISVVEERTVGPSLGKDSIKAGSLSLLIAFGLVLIYMFLIYGKVAFIANSVLIINILFLVSWLVLFEATLTLPGIAGIALTVGMAVDANVLIFERIREEQQLGRSKISAIETGFSQAFRAILDANVTTLIAAIILFFMGSGPIRGFSITLGLGVFSTIICTMIVSRLLINHFYVNNKERELLL